MYLDPIDLTRHVGGPILLRAKKAMEYYKNGQAMPRLLHLADAIAVLVNIDEACVRLDRDKFYAWLYRYYAENNENCCLGQAFLNSSLVREMRIAGLCDPELYKMINDGCALRYIHKEYLMSSSELLF